MQTGLGLHYKTFNINCGVRHMELKDRLIQLRKENKMTQADLADALNISRQAVSRWETALAVPSTENLMELSRLYGVSIDTILDNDGKEEAVTEGVIREKTEEPIRHSKRWKHIKVVVIVLVISIITVVVGAAISITRAQEHDIVSIEEFNEDSYVNPGDVEIIDIEIS